MLRCVLRESADVIAIRLERAAKCATRDRRGRRRYLAFVPDKKESGGQESVADRIPRRERVDEELDVGGVIFVHDRGLLVEDDVFHEF